MTVGILTKVDRHPVGVGRILGQGDGQVVGFVATVKGTRNEEDDHAKDDRNGPDLE